MTSSFLDLGAAYRELQSEIDVTVARSMVSFNQQRKQI